MVPRTLFSHITLVLLIATLLLTGCDVPGDVRATETPAAGPRQGTSTAVTLTATPVLAARSPEVSVEAQSTAAPEADGSAAGEQGIVALVAAMQQAVIARDKDAYLSHVDLTDPVFALEHRRWADGWVEQPPESFSLEVDNVALDGSSATGALTVRWERAAGDVDERTATLPVRFALGADGRWRFAGEAWVSYPTEHFTVRVLPGLEEVAAELIPELPEVYAHVTGFLGYSPDRKMEIKLYDSSEALVAMTLLSLPEIGGWNEPGEALKYRAARYTPALKGGIAHEFTHFLTFDMAGTAHTRMPWWLEEGLAVYAGSEFYPPERNEERLREVRDWAVEGDLADWQSMSDFKSTPYALWDYVYSQGYAIVRYVTERFGAERRNRWIASMAVEMEIEQATAEMLGLSFEELHRGFVAWAKALKVE